jgi:hypothetical protein
MPSSVINEEFDMMDLSRELNTNFIETDIENKVKKRVRFGSRMISGKACDT